MVLKHWAMKPNDWMLYLTKMKVSLLPYVPAPPFIRVWSFTRAFFLDLCNLTDHLQIIVIVIIIGSMVLGGPCPTQAIVTSDLNPGHPPASFLASSSTLTFHLDFSQPCPLWLAGFVHNISSGNSFSSIDTTWPTHLRLLDFITLTIFPPLGSHINYILARFLCFLRV